MNNNKSFRYHFTNTDSKLGEVGFKPILPFNLIYQGTVKKANGLLDTGASVNVLPYSLGIELGAIWEKQTISLELTGNLANFEACILLLEAICGDFSPVSLVFAWTKADHIPLILGQVNFFMEFDVCFYRSLLSFEIRRLK